MDEIFRIEWVGYAIQKHNALKLIAQIAPLKVILHTKSIIALQWEDVEHWWD